MNAQGSWVVAFAIAASAVTSTSGAVADGAGRDAAGSSASGKTSSPRSSKAASPKKGAHPPTAAFERAVDPTIIPTAPPIARDEQMPASPGDKYVWVPGHYVPLQRKWTWTPGEWMVPPDPGAVWISGRYDVQTRRWTPGYWQPGDPYPATDTAPAPK